MTAQSAWSTKALGVEGLWFFLAALTIFLGAFLLFQVELLIAKMILPWFGGSAAVWLTCLMFFQVALLGGYCYAHVLVGRVSPIWRTRVHIGLLAASLAFLPVIPAESWKPAGDASPLPLILGLLGATIGLPFLLLSSATPLLQAWIAGAQTGRTPSVAPAAPHSIYRLYALSNLGSILALLSYPLLVEPSLPTREQASIWSAGYALFALLYIALTWRHRGTAVVTVEAPGRAAPEETPVTSVDRYFWFLLPLAASALLLAVTNNALRNIAPVPLFWMAPLALYLLSFIVSFDHPRWYYRPLWLTLFVVAAAFMSLALTGEFRTRIRTMILAFWLASLFASCMVCHGELARLKPGRRGLTSYYLTIAAGGAVGGILVSVIAPLVFPADFDLLIILPATALIVIAAIWRYRPRTWNPLIARVALVGALLMLAVSTWDIVRREYFMQSVGIFFERNFYGPLRVEDRGAVRILMNGTINHGAQYLTPFGATEPVSYYAKTSGIGIALTELGQKGPLKVGTVGLGTGTIAAYARAGDVYSFYEINPAVPGISRTYFRYLDVCMPECDIVLGDARLSLEREEPQQFDLLAVDAFNSDSIPVHLLTREAFALYWRHLKPDGILAIHASNTYVNLAPIVALAAQETGRIARLFMDTGRGDAVQTTEWVLVAGNAAVFDPPTMREGQQIPIPANLRIWTDDYSNLWQSVR